VFQRGSPWADGPSMVTQCPVKPGCNYTYRFNVRGQEGTLWWHAHISFLRATVYGALVIRPRGGAASYPFSPKPHREEVLLLGEWWNANVYDLERTAFLSGNITGPANAYTINGKPGDPYSNCSAADQTYKFHVRRNETYLLRIINAALNTPMFLRVANHSFTVVAADAAYTTPYETDVVVVAPGQTVDALMAAAGAAPGRYYMVATPYDSAVGGTPPFNRATARAVVEYAGAAGDETPQLPPPTQNNDTATAFRFLSNLTALVLPGKPTVPLSVDTRMFVTVGLGNGDCQPKQTLCNTTDGTRPRIFSSSMNNASFLLPDAGSPSMLQAHYDGNASGVYTRDFPDRPPVIFDYTADASDTDELKYTTKSTKVRTLRYNETVEMVLQNTRLIAKESHPMHLHGFNFFVLAQGFGNYDEAPPAPGFKFNLVNPQERNTVAVPTGGWAVIRFVANNPGMWFMHCHFDAHLDLGLGMVFEVQDGPTAETSVPPPPLDLPHC